MLNKLHLTQADYNVRESRLRIIIMINVAVATGLIVGLATGWYSLASAVGTILGFGIGRWSMKWATFFSGRR